MRMHVQYVHTAHTPLATVSLATLVRRRVRCQFNGAGGFCSFESCDVSQQSRRRGEKTRNLLPCKSCFKHRSLVNLVQTVMYFYTCMEVFMLVNTLVSLL